MVAPGPELLRRIRNTENLIAAGIIFSEINTYAQLYPEEYLSVEVYNILMTTRPWEAVTVPVIPSSEFEPSIGYAPPFPTSSPYYIGPNGDRILVICVDFSDKPAQISTETVYNRYFGSGNSFRNYYVENSYGSYTPEGKVYGWYRAPHPLSWYTNGAYGRDACPDGSNPNGCSLQLIKDALSIAAGDVDWNYIDANGDGTLSTVMIVHAGGEAAYTGSVNDLWARAWVWSPTGCFEHAGGKCIQRAAISAEYMHSSGDTQRSGTDCHEFGHLLGLLDLYDYTLASEGVGRWSLMGSGNWLNDGITPGHFDAWSKIKLGWINPVTETIASSLKNIESNKAVLKYYGMDTNSYFLFENRQKTGFDSYLPGSGLLIWRINENKSNNGDKNCYLVGLLQADGKKDLENKRNRGDAGDPYPGTANNRKWGPDTDPSNVLCDGTLLQYINILNISDSSPEMTFNMNFAPIRCGDSCWRDASCSGTQGDCFGIMSDCQNYCRYACTGEPDYHCALYPGSGAYADLASCQAACKKPPPEKRYGCSGYRDGMTFCTESEMSPYKSCDECIATLPLIHRTCSGAPDYICEPDEDGSYVDLDACKAECIPPTTKKYRCTGDPDYSCVEDPDGVYDTLKKCNDACLPPECSKLLCSMKLN